MIRFCPFGKDFYFFFFTNNNGPKLQQNFQSGGGGGSILFEHFFKKVFKRRKNLTMNDRYIGFRQYIYNIYVSYMARRDMQFRI